MIYSYCIAIFKQVSHVTVIHSDILIIFFAPATLIKFQLI